MNVTNTSPWWRDYRRRKHKPKEYLNTEMILRKSFVQALKEYTKHSSIAGFKDMFKARIHWAHRILCILLFVLMISTTIYILHHTWFGTLAKPLIVTMESTTYPISKIHFPAVAICNVNRISKKALKELARQLHPQIALNNETVEQVEEYCLQLGRLIDYTYDESITRYTAFKKTIERMYSSRSIIDAMRKLAPSCEEMLLKCAWGGNSVDCSSIFRTRRTVGGHCCAFNYVLNYDADGKPNTTSALVKRQVVPGLYHGLSVILDPMLDDYAYPLHNLQGFDVLLFDGTHYADASGGRVIHRIVEPNQAELFELKTIKQRAAAEVRKYPYRTRNCLFQDEMKDQFGELYSHSACLVKCRTVALQSLCKCTPYFYPSDVHDHICNVEDLHCLDKYKDKLMYVYPLNAMEVEGLEGEMQDSLYCPHCLPDCELTQHNIKSFKTALTTDENYIDRGFQHKFIQHINLTDKCVLSVYQSTADGILNRLDVVAYWFEVLSNVGGFGGILVGFSIICLTELVYFLCFRFIKLILINFKNYH